MLEGEPSSSTVLTSGPPRRLPCGARRCPRVEPAAGTRRGLVLYISDDPESRILLTRMARRWQTVKLLLSETGRGGLRLALVRRPDVIVLDDRLPDAAGADVLAQLRHLLTTVNTPVVVIGSTTAPAHRRVVARFGSGPLLDQAAAHRRARADGRDAVGAGRHALRPGPRPWGQPALNPTTGDADVLAVDTPAPSRNTEHGFGLLGVVLSLLVVGALSAGAVAAMGSGGGTGGSSPSFGSDVGRAYDVEAQSNLSNAAQNVLDAAATSGGYAGVDLSQYGVVAGPSASPQTVSGAVSAGTGIGAAGALTTGSATLAVRSRSGTCWFAWVSSGPTWYGAQANAASCMAVPMVSAPSAGAGGGGGITWQSGSYPIT